jgi:hypothetical protein
VGELRPGQTPAGMESRKADGTVQIKQRRRTIFMSILSPDGRMLSFGKYPANKWSAELAARRADEHGLRYVRLRELGLDSSTAAAFKTMGIEVSSSSPSSASPTAKLLKHYGKSLIDIRRLSAGACAKPVSHLVADYDGVVESFDNDGCATTVLEDKNGERTEVRFYTSILQEHGIDVNTRFTYQVYKTRDGGGIKFLPKKPQELSADEWAMSRKKARELAELLAEPEQNAP